MDDIQSSISMMHVFDLDIRADIVTIFGTAQRVGKLEQCASFAVVGVQIALSDHVKSLGVTID